MTWNESINVDELWLDLRTGDGRDGGYPLEWRLRYARMAAGSFYMLLTRSWIEVMNTMVGV